MNLLRIPILVTALLLAATALTSVQAQEASTPPFPELTGPVVDQAGLLPGDARASLEQKLRNYDQTSGNQLVVVTVPTLNGYPLEDYGYLLGRHWGIGQKGKNTGALLIVDRDEHQLRIEAGYGLEGTLTDAQSDNIIRNIIVPRFKQGDYPGGIGAGVDAILTVLGGEQLQVQQQTRRDHSSILFFILLILFIGLRFFTSGFFFPGSFYGRRGYRGWGGWGGGFGGGGFGGGGFGGGGFSGGGGSFGGGGASGRW